MTNKLYRQMNWPKIEDIIYSESDNPHELLGPHKCGGQTLVQAYFPQAKEAEIVFEQSGETVERSLPTRTVISRHSCRAPGSRRITIR